MAAADSPKSVSRVFLRLAVSGLLVAGVVGGVLIQRAPVSTFMPVMAARPVIFPDGTAIFVQRHEVTIAEWNNCHAQGACALELRAASGRNPATTPATGLSYLDAQEYVSWISSVTGHAFRLPTVPEWEFMAASVLPEVPDPLFTDPSLTWASAYLVEGVAPRALRPQGSFSISSHGIADLDGSVWEWTQDCYAGATESVDPAYCPAFFVGGEHQAVMSFLVRDPARGGCAVGTPPAHLGMRLVTDAAI
ncbi:formylglycine-generating enzyme required for sulfatase activity [Rhodovulum imhoffii]|uniref:Formylglycine-generating enzyme required for sulfatase activity n=1 Tax=Rhodovulum imhoffii TaxID=365340 RepID=A0A2T5BQU3_9RHOB|nr:SUMF1/EgtB/PvdO family nonheme iron enzyme [Rhodovulum imhoffii]MBK5932601.1 nitrate reductase [Rhodovulum imhoffii]PTN01616.1 formylglycine-generating enzyme required for sulfatase activity [Rhodovulum imhoffii]